MARLKVLAFQLGAALVVDEALVAVLGLVGVGESGIEGSGLQFVLVGFGGHDS